MSAPQGLVSRTFEGLVWGRLARSSVSEVGLKTVPWVWVHFEVKIHTWGRPRSSPAFLGHCCVGDSCQPLLSALKHWYPWLVGVSGVLPQGGCLLQHLLNLGLGLCDSLLNLLCYPPPGVCSHSIFIFCCLRLINKALESCSSHTHTTEGSPVHPIPARLWTADQVLYSPSLLCPNPQPTQVSTSGSKCACSGKREKRNGAKPASQPAAKAEPWPNTRTPEFWPRLTPTLLWGSGQGSAVISFLLYKQGV